MNMTDEEFSRISVLIKRRYGIDLSRKKEIVSGRLENYVRLGGWKNYSEYIHAVEADFTGELEKKLVNMLSTNHTFFMREFEHFEFMRSTVLPELKKKEAYRKDLSIWCGASSTGEEAYTLAMLIKDYLGLEYEQWETTILATDISTEVLKKAVAGIYTAEQIENLPKNWKQRYFRLHGSTDCYEVIPEIRKKVLFRQFNLMEPFPFKRKMHVIFIRNVMIYFDAPTKRELIYKIYQALEPGGYLFIGRTETIERDIVPFQMIEPSIFRKQ